ncbi:STAS domain-containing protein [Treponema parvum]|nr:STAS domain-containing protein [Treponema parvum]
MFKPELISSLRTYNMKSFFADLSAGIIVGVVALPLAIAFGIASGVKPEQGIFTAIVAGFLISALGGSKVQIGGPTGAFVVIVYSVVQQYGYSGLAIATIMAGVMLILLGILKLGGLISFIPYTIITGFTAGIAVTIFTTQIGDFLGLAVSGMPGDFFGKIKVYAKAIGTIDIYTSIVATVSLAAIFIWPRFNKKIPGSLVVIVLSTIVCLTLKKVFGFEIATIGSRYGEIPVGLPLPKILSFSGAEIKELFPVSVSIAMLAAIESLLSAVVADGMTGTKHNSNTELIAQGIANIASPIFGGIPATGAIARTATNIKNGGRTPVAGIIHALTLLLITFFLGRYVVYIPMAALAAVLVSVSWNMAGIPAVRELLKGQKSDSAVLFITFFLTVFIDLTVAIGAGLLFAAFFFIKKMVDISTVREYGDISDGLISESEGEKPLNVPDGILVYEVLGPLFFGTVRKFEIAVERAGVEYKVLILRLRHTNYLDAGGIMVLTQLKNACDKKGIKIVLAGVHPQPLKLLTKTGMAEKIGTENIFDNFAGALKHAVKIRN